MRSLLRLTVVPERVAAPYANDPGRKEREIPVTVRWSASGAISRRPVAA